MTGSSCRRDRFFDLDLKLTLRFKITDTKQLNRI